MSSDKNTRIGRFILNSLDITPELSGDRNRHVGNKRLRLRPSLAPARRKPRFVGGVRVPVNSDAARQFWRAPPRASFGREAEQSGVSYKCLSAVP